MPVWFAAPDVPGFEAVFGFWKFGLLAGLPSGYGVELAERLGEFVPDRFDPEPAPVFVPELL